MWACLKSGMQRTTPVSVAQSADAVVIAILMPHAPILIPALAGKRGVAASATVEAMEKAARRVVEHRPDAVVLVSPHAPRRAGGFGLWKDDPLQGSLEGFGAPELAVQLPAHAELVRSIEREGRLRDLAFWSIRRRGLDHGAVVPLWHLAHAGWRGPTVVVGLSEPGGAGLEALGKSIAAAAAATRVRLGLVASGDMSHRLQPGAPAGFHPDAQRFDRGFIEWLRRGADRAAAPVQPELQELAGEDVVDSTVVALAAVGWQDSGREVLSYQGPFGVGYGVAVLWEACGEKGAPASVGRGVGSTGLPEIGRRSLEAWFAAGGREDGSPVPGMLRNGGGGEPRGVFVTLRGRDGALRGCVGTLAPRFSSVAEETWWMARAAAFEDHRFEPLTAAELPDVRIEVSVVQPLERVDDLARLDPRRYGVVVQTADGRRGALLPGIADVRDAREQLKIARRKGGIGADEPVSVSRFEVEKSHESGWLQAEDAA